MTFVFCLYHRRGRLKSKPDKSSVKEASVVKFVWICARWGEDESC
jgi:hypothetical protein